MTDWDHVRAQIAASIRAEILIAETGGTPYEEIVQNLFREAPDIVQEGIDFFHRHERE